MDSKVHTVLIIEDDESISTFLRQTLELKDISVIVAESGARAIEIAARGGISLMTIDYSLPDMTGDEVVLSLKKSGIDIPFIMITGMGDEDIAVSSMKLGARDYLVKNDNLFERVPRVVAEILDKLKAEEQLRSVREAFSELEERFSKVFHHSNDGMIILDSELSVVNVNNQALRFLGYDSADELTGRDLTSFLSPLDGSSREDVLHTLQGKSPKRFEARFYKKANGFFLADVVPSTFVAAGQHQILLNFRDISERLHYLEELKKASEEWRTTFDSISDLVSVHDGEMRIVKVNKAFADFVNLPYSEIIGQKCFELLHPAGITFENCPHRKTIDEGIVVTEEVYHQDIGITQLLTTSPIFDAQGLVTGSVHIAKDISDLTKIHGEMEDKERFLGHILDSIQDGITILDRDFRVVRANKFIEEKYAGRMPLVGKNCHDVFQNRDEPCELCPTRRTLDSRRPSSEVIRFQTPERKKCGWMEVFTYPLFDSDTGEVAGVIEYMRDITKRRITEEELRESEEKYRRLFEDANDAILVANAATGIITDCNRAAEYLTGRERDELVGIHQRELHPPEERGSAEFSHAFSRQKSLSSADSVHTKILRPDGKVRDVSIRATNLTYHGEKFVQGVFRDITERKRLNERVKQAQKLESIGTLAGGIAHDFNNILTAVIGFAEIVKTDLALGNQPGLEDVDGILEAARRATDLVRQVLTFSRQSESEFRNVDLSPVVKETVKFLNASLPSTISIEQKISMVTKTVYADPVQMHQIVMNLCTNAHHAMREKGGTLSISLDEITLTDEYIGNEKEVPPGAYVRISVSDTGHGMDEITIARVFDPFFSTKSRNEGTGLGLSVVHGIVENHGGRITVYSSVGTGTTFRVYIPVARQEEKGHVQSTQEDIIPTGNERLLLVDDEEIIIKTSTRMLSRLGYNVTAYTKSNECLEAFRSSPDRFDLVITDLTMPKMTGLDLAREIKKISPETPVILMTGFASALEEGNLSEHNIDFLVKKPVLKKDIANAIRAVLDKEKKSG